ncbi:MAG: LytTR family transcriptional regulator [Proteobacteria bacterium]|nr:LytTR family transcriptional regulator [Pseudomonadota bacterium]
MLLLKNKLKDLKLQAILIVFVVSIIILMMVHDYLTSLIFNQSYYFSESILFKIPIVLLIVPIFIYGSMLKSSHDFKLSKEINLTKIMIYLIPTVIIHIVIASWLIALVAQVFMDSPVPFEFLIKNKFTQDFVFILTIYGLMYLIARYYSLNIQPNKNKLIKTLSIKQGTNTHVIAVDDIDWIAAETPYIGIWVDKKKYLYPATLSGILTKLNNDNFIRVHRSTIINKTKIQKIQSRENGDYDLFLNDDTVIRLSRNYRKEFNTQFK